jgi:hypothetical protein
VNTLRNQFTEVQQATIPSYDSHRMTSSYTLVMERSEACIPEASPVGDSTAHVPNP